MSLLVLLFIPHFFSGMDESLVRDNYSKLNESIDRATEKAEKRIEELAGKAADAEK